MFGLSPELMQVLLPVGAALLTWLFKHKLPDSILAPSVPSAPAVPAPAPVAPGVPAAPSSHPVLDKISQDALVILPFLEQLLAARKQAQAHATLADLAKDLPLPAGPLAPVKA